MSPISPIECALKCKTVEYPYDVYIQQQVCMSLIENGVWENLQQKHEANGRRITIQIVPWEIEKSIPIQLRHTYLILQMMIRI